MHLGRAIQQNIELVNGEMADIGGYLDGSRKMREDGGPRSNADAGLVRKKVAVYLQNTSEAY